MLGFLLRRVLAILGTLLVVTVILYSLAMLTPLEERANLYMPNFNTDRVTPERIANLRDLIIKRYGLNKPFPIQYANWLVRLVQGEWGYSPTAKQDVLSALLQRTPATVELILYSLILFIPMGLISGLLAGSRPYQRFDNTFRLGAFFATATPPFLLALVLLSIFWVGLYWFPIGQLGTAENAIIHSQGFHRYTGLITIDGLLNGRPNVSLDSLRHLVLPVLTLSLYHWATLGRITRAATIEEMGKEYILAARGRGIRQGQIIWRHTLRNVMVPALNSSALSAASLVTGLFITEVIFLYNGVSSMFKEAIFSTPDVASALGFAIYSVLAVLFLMTLLDLLQAALDPRIRAGIFAS